jgi:oligoendopeptidase F
MLESQQEAYGNVLDSKFLHPYAWINKVHYYLAEQNFYNFPYAFGMLFAKGLYAQYLQKGEVFVKEYDEFLRATGKHNIADAAKIMGVDVHSIDFWRSSLEIIKKDIEKFVAL